MRASSPSSRKIGRKSKGLISLPHGCRMGLFVCGCCSSWLSCFSMPSYFLLFLYFVASSSPFLVSSEEPLPFPIPPSPSPLKPFTPGGESFQTHKQKHSIVDLKIAIAIGVSSFLFLSGIVAMVLLICFGFKTRPKRASDSRVSVTIDCEQNLADDEGNLKGARRFNWGEVERFTMNFNDSYVIGVGGFSTVYLARFPDSTLGAVKISHSGSERLTRFFKQELEILLHVQHTNIVKLLGYCDSQEECVLVFEYVPNGTLQERLHEGKRSVLSWRNRMAIAFQLAQVIEYLHEKCALHIVHGDIKASNVLLDEKFNCKLCDFGSAKMGFSSTVMPPSSSRNRMMLGSPGYTDPQFMRTGIASKKNDIYSFGVIVLELITGIEACSETGERLTSKVGPMLRDENKAPEMVDPRLKGLFDLEEAKAMASIAAMCLGDSPSLRPSASDILTTMKSRISSISSLLSRNEKV